MIEVADTDEHVIYEGEDSSTATDDEPEQQEVEVRRPQSLDTHPCTC